VMAARGTLLHTDEASPLELRVVEFELADILRATPIARLASRVGDYLAVSDHVVKAIVDMAVKPKVRLLYKAVKLADESCVGRFT